VRLFAEEHVRACLARVRWRIRGIASVWTPSAKRRTILSIQKRKTCGAVAGLSTILISRDFLVLSSHNRKRGVKATELKF